MHVHSHLVRCIIIKTILPADARLLCGINLSHLPTRDGSLLIYWRAARRVSSWFQTPRS